MCWRWEAPTYSDPYVAYPELYDPLGSTWGPAGTLTTARRQHTASTLRSGASLRACALEQAFGHGHAGGPAVHQVVHEDVEQRRPRGVHPQLRHPRRLQ